MTFATRTATGVRGRFSRWASAYGPAVVGFAVGYGGWQLGERTGYIGDAERSAAWRWQATARDAFAANVVNPVADALGAPQHRWEMLLPPGGGADGDGDGAPARVPFTEILSSCQPPEQLDWIRDHLHEEIPYFYMEELLLAFCRVHQWAETHALAAPLEHRGTAAEGLIRAVLPTSTPSSSVALESLEAPESSEVGGNAVAEGVLAAAAAVARDSAARRRAAARVPAAAAAAANDALPECTDVCALLWAHAGRRVLAPSTLLETLAVLSRDVENGAWLARNAAPPAMPIAASVELPDDANGSGADAAAATALQAAPVATRRPPAAFAAAVVALATLADVGQRMPQGDSDADERQRRAVARAETAAVRLLCNGEAALRRERASTWWRRLMFWRSAKLPPGKLLLFAAAPVAKGRHGNAAADAEALAETHDRVTELVGRFVRGTAALAKADDAFVVSQEAAGKSDSSVQAGGSGSDRLDDLANRVACLLEHADILADLVGCAPAT